MATEIRGKGRARSGPKPDTSVKAEELPPNFDASFQLPDSRQEQFAQCLSDGMTQVAAYETAGYVAQASNANVMAQRPMIKARVEWLKRRKAEEAGLKFTGELVVDLDKVNAKAPKGSPEWFLYQVFYIAEGNDENAKVTDKLRALQLGADWMGYFGDKKPLKTKDPKDDEPQAVSQNSPRRIVAGTESALSKYSEVLDGIGPQAAKPVEDGCDRSDHGGGVAEAEESVAEQ